MAVQCPRVFTSRLAAALNATHPRLDHASSQAREVLEPQKHVRRTSAEPPKTTPYINLSQQEVSMHRLSEVTGTTKGSSELKMAPHQLSKIAAYLLSWQVKLTTTEEELMNVYRGWVLTADY